MSRLSVYQIIYVPALSLTSGYDGLDKWSYFQTNSWCRLERTWRWNPLSVEDTMHISLIGLSEKWTHSPQVCRWSHDCTSTKWIAWIHWSMTSSAVFIFSPGRPYSTRGIRWFLKMLVVALEICFFFCTKWVLVYTQCVTPSQEDIYRVKAFNIRFFYGYELYLQGSYGAWEALNFKLFFQGLESAYILPKALNSPENELLKSHFAFFF